MANVTNSITNNYDYYDYSDYQKDKRAHNIWIYGTPVLLVLGTIGNILSVLVMARKALRVHTTSLYLIILAIVDTAVLYTGLLRYWILELSDVDIRTLSTASCKIHIFIVYFLIQFEAWILVCVTVERLAAVFYPQNTRLIFTKKFALIQIAITGVILIAVDSHFFWSYTLSEGVCVTVGDIFQYFEHVVWSWLDFVLASLAPFVLMLAINTAIITRLVVVQRKRQSINAAAGQRRSNSMTAILLTVNCVFFVTTAPIALYLSTADTWKRKAATEEDYITVEIVWACVNMAAYTNNAINFVLYCLSGPSFRRELTKMFGLKRPVNKVHSLHLSTVSRIRVN